MRARTPVRLLILFLITAVLHGASSVSADSLKGITADPEEGMPVCVGIEPAVRIGDPCEILAEPTHLTVGELLPCDNWEPVESLTTHVKVGAGSCYTAYFDHLDFSLGEIELPSPLCDEAREAVLRAPGWLRESLADNFGRLEASHQRIFAGLILDAEDPLVDEIAFQVARMAPVSLTHELFDPDLIVENAQLLYEHDQVLQYVEIVDHGSAAAGGDYYSTTQYRVVHDEDTTWVEIPKEMYYWYVVHPKLSDETVKMSAEVDSRQATYGYFWRYFLFSNPDTEHDYSDSAGIPGVYPVLGEVLTLPTVYWDGEQHNVPYGRPFTADDLALDIIGNWVSRVVPNAASGNRPIQPNQIVYEHNGNCGELQDALGAAARTGLIPTVCVSNHCEDHVWNEFFWMRPEDDWHAYQVSLGGSSTHINNPGIAYDYDVGGSKSVSGVWVWRGDGYTYSVVDRYSNFCTLVVQVEDANGKPVDGALVLLWSDAWGGGGLTSCIWAYTDSKGFCSLKLGDLQDYYMHVQSSIGDYPPGGLDAVVQIIDDSEPNQPYFKSVTIAGAVPRHECQVDATQGDRYQMRIQFDIPHEIIYGANLYGDDADFAKWEHPGLADLFLMDQANYELYIQGDEFTAAVAAQDVGSGEVIFSLADPITDWYLILSNEDHLVNTQGIDAHVVLYRNTQGISDLPLVDGAPRLEQNWPNPFSLTTTIYYAVPAFLDHTPRASLEIYNVLGHRVRTLVDERRAPGRHSVTWDGIGGSGLPVGSGVYFCRLAVWPSDGAKPMVTTRKLIYSD